MRVSYSHPTAFYRLTTMNLFDNSVVSDTGVLRRETDDMVVKGDVTRVSDRKKKISEGRDASTYYSAYGSKTDYISHQGRPWIWRNGPNYFSCLHGGSYVLGGSSPVKLEVDPQLMRQLLVKANSRFAADVKQKRSKFAGPVFLAELRDTVKLVKSPVKGVAKALDSYLWNCYKAGRRNQRALNLRLHGERIVKEVNDLYLQLTYAVKPLLSDTLGIAEALADWPTDRFSPMCRGNANDTFVTYVGGGQPAFVSTICDAVYRGTKVLKVGQTIRGKLKATAVLPVKGSAARLVQVLGFNTEEFVPTLYELIPFSFVLDYFSNAGELLSANSTDLSWVEWSHLSTYQTVEEEGLVYLTPRVPPAQLRQVGNQLFGGAHKAAWNFVRAPNPELSFFGDQLTFFNGTPNSWANVGSLLVSFSKDLWYKPPGKTAHRG